MTARLKEAKKSGEPGWLWRRWVIFPNVIASFWIVTMLINAPSTPVNETIAWAMTINIIASILFYTGFATAQDITAILATRSGRPYAEKPPVPDDPDVAG